MSEETRCGIDVLLDNNFAPLRGRRVGLITNHTGLRANGQPTVDAFARASEFRLCVLFSPEHGIRGAQDELVADGSDAQTGLPVFSLYGPRNRPTPEQTADIDALVYDIQDVGTRFYTYISTLKLCLESAAEHNLAFVVLDRPNPIGGTKAEGPCADPDRLDFVACHSIPIRHGLTTGELARLFVRELGLNVELTVVPVESWNRAQWWDETGLLWTHPSPNMRSLTEALLYPGIGLLEFTNVSVGRGTGVPFELLGAPWIDPRVLARRLNAAGLPGIRFAPIQFTPSASVHASALCGGVQCIITARERFMPVLTGLTIAETLLALYPDSWSPAKYDRLLVHESTYRRLIQGASAESLAASWESDLRLFADRRASCLLYPDANS